MFRSALISASFLTASLLAAVPAAAPAATSAVMPTCAAGDAVVWENSRSKVFHVSGDKYYGNTKNGAYACQSAAVAAGYHAAGSKSGASGTPVPATGGAMTPATSPDAMASPSGRHHHRHHGSGASPAPAVSAPVPAAT